jgi:hypothetical protein
MDLTRQIQGHFSCLENCWQEMSSLPQISHLFCNKQRVQCVPSCLCIEGSRRFRGRAVIPLGASSLKVDQYLVERT